MNPIQRPTGWRTYFQAIWDTIDLSDFGKEIWLAIKYFVNFLRGKEGTRSGEPTKMQQTCVFAPRIRYADANDQFHAGHDRAKGEDTHGVVHVSRRPTSFRRVKTQPV